MKYSGRTMQVESITNCRARIWPRGRQTPFLRSGIFRSSYVLMGRCSFGGNILSTGSPKLCWWVTFWSRDQRLPTTDPATCSSNSNVQNEQLSPVWSGSLFKSWRVPMLLLRTAGNKYGSDPSTDACEDVMNKGATKENSSSQLLTMVTSNSTN